MAVKPKFTEQMVVLVTTGMRDYVEAVSETSEQARSKVHRHLLELGIAAHREGPHAPSEADITEAAIRRITEAEARPAAKAPAARASTGTTAKVRSRPLRTTEAKPAPVSTPAAPVEQPVKVVDDDREVEPQRTPVAARPKTEPVPASDMTEDDKPRRAPRLRDAMGKR